MSVMTLGVVLGTSTLMIFPKLTRNSPPTLSSVPAHSGMTSSLPHTIIDGLPQWSTGDEWEVEYTVPAYRSRGLPDDEGWATLRYKFTVLPEHSDSVYPGHEVRKLSVQGTWPNRTVVLTFDVAAACLIKIEDKVTGGDAPALLNPFGLQAWMLHEHGHPPPFFDFPNLRQPSGADVIVNVGEKYPWTVSTEDVDDATPPFCVRTSVEFMENGEDVLLSTLSRVDYVTGGERKIQFRWVRGEKWWRSARITFDGKFRASATRL